MFSLSLQQEIHKNYLSKNGLLKVMLMTNTKWIAVFHNCVICYTGDMLMPFAFGVLKAISKHTGRDTALKL